MPGWKTAQAGGKTYDVYAQEATWNCGLACCAMVVNQKGQGKPTSRALAQESQNYGANYIPANCDKVSFSGRGMNAELLRAVHNRALQLGDSSQVKEYARARGLSSFRQIARSMKDGDNPGAGMSNLASVLNAFGFDTRLKGDPTAGKISSALGRATPSSPVIIALTKPAHGVVCLGKAGMFSNRFVMLDPFHGSAHDDAQLSGTTIRFGEYDTVILEMIIVS